MSWERLRFSCFRTRSSAARSSCGSEVVTVFFVRVVMAHSCPLGWLGPVYHTGLLPALSATAGSNRHGFCACFSSEPSFFEFEPDLSKRLLGGVLVLIDNGFDFTAK